MSLPFVSPSLTHITFSPSLFHYSSTLPTTLGICGHSECGLVAGGGGVWIPSRQGETRSRGIHKPLVHTSYQHTL